MNDDSPPVVLGIDPGLNVCGWGLLRVEARPVYVSSGAIRPSARNPLAKRLLALHSALSEVIARYGPAEVAIEDPFVRAVAPQSALAIGQARAVAVLAAAQAGLEVSFYAPASVKAAVAGYGQSDKRQVQTMVRILLDLAADPEPSDAADALAVAFCHLGQRKMRTLEAASR
jgi:crossover junction endodeoxyribonuclease RuvC